MTVSDFLIRHKAAAQQIPGEECVRKLLEQMEEGLSGRGNIPMLPSFLPPVIQPPRGKVSCVLDAGGTNLRVAQAYFDDQGRCTIQNLREGPMPGSREKMDADAFYSVLARKVRELGAYDRIGFCFSYNVEMDSSLDGKLLAWCKEIDVPDAVGRRVGASLAEKLGYPCRVHVLNDSVAAMVGAASSARVGVILGTGTNVCYPETCANIPKLREKLSGSMIISTEVGEFDGIPKSDFDLALYDTTDDPSLARGEKQCSGGYLGQQISIAWQHAAREKLISEEFAQAAFSLREISEALSGVRTRIPDDAAALEIAEKLIHRAAKIAAILCAGPILRCTGDHQKIAVAMEGSQYWKLTGFKAQFHRELDALLEKHSIAYEIVRSENACLAGAALAAFAG